MSRRWTLARSRKRLAPLIAVAVIALAAWLLYRTLRDYSLEEIGAQLRGLDWRRASAAAAFAAASYGCLTLFDFFALRYAERPLSYPRAALASFVSLSIGHNVGLAALSSGAVRYRFYSRWGLSAGDWAKVILFCGLTVAVGLAGLAAVALLLRQDLATRVTGLSHGRVVAVAIGILVLLAGYLTLCKVARRELRIASWAIRLPSLNLACVQILIGTLNFLFVAACLHQSLSTVISANFLDVAAAYAVANVASLVTHVPGGLGVVEAVMVAALPGERVLGGLIVFRLVYFLVPLLLGGTLLALSELLIRRSPAPGATSTGTTGETV